MPTSIRIGTKEVLYKHNMERRNYAISGSHGFTGEHLMKRYPDATRLDRNGFVPENTELIFDLATYGNLASHSKNPREIYNANLMRVVTSTHWMEDETNLVFVSSSSVMRPKQSLYSLSKKAAEEYLQNMHKNTAIVRPYSITGPGEQEEHLIPTLIRSAKTGKEMPFVPWAVHDYFDVRDFCSALSLVADKGEKKGEIYEVGSGTPVTNQQVREIVEEVVGSPVRIKEVGSMRDYDSDDWVSNNESISSLGWEPRYSLRQTIRDMVNN